MQVQPLPSGAPLKHPPLSISEASSFPNTPRARVNKLALALLAGLSAALVAGGVYLSIKALVILGSISTVISVAALVFNFSGSSVSRHSPKQMSKAEKVLSLITTDTPGALSSIKKVSFWKKLSKDEDKKAIIKAWLEKRWDLTLIPFEKLDPSLLVLTYEVIKENPALSSLADFCRNYRCKELINKMTYEELYDQEGTNVKFLFLPDQTHENETQETKPKGKNRFTLDWDQWNELKDCQARLIACVLVDLTKSKFPDEGKKRSVNRFVDKLFKNIDRIQLIGDKETSLFFLLRAAQFDFQTFAEQIENPLRTQRYADFLFEIDPLRDKRSN